MVGHLGHEVHVHGVHVHLRVVEVERKLLLKLRIADIEVGVFLDDVRWRCSVVSLGYFSFLSWGRGWPLRFVSKSRPV